MENTCPGNYERNIEWGNENYNDRKITNSNLELEKNTEEKSFIGEKMYHFTLWIWVRLCSNIEDKQIEISTSWNILKLVKHF